MSSRHNIIDKFVDSAKTPGCYRDAKDLGFCLKVTERQSDQSLRKVFIVNGKIKNGESVTVTIGAYPEWSVERARLKAKTYILQLKEGINPNELKAEQLEALATQRTNKSATKAITLQKVLDDYLDTKSHKQKESTQKFYRYTLQGASRDWLDKPMIAISEAMVLERYKELVDQEQEAKAESFRRVLRALFKYAMRAYKDSTNAPLIRLNPVDYLTDMDVIVEVKPRDRVIEPDQLEAWFKAVLALKKNEAIRDYLLLLMLTGLRKNEAAGLLWNDVNFQKGFLTARDTKNGTDHVVPLTSSIRSILKRLDCNRVGDGNFVFGSNSKSGYIKCTESHIRAVIKASTVAFDLHDLRRTFTTIAAQILPELVVKDLINHRSKADVTQRHYTKFGLTERTEALHQLNVHILNLAKVTLPENNEVRRKIASINSNR